MKKELLTLLLYTFSLLLFAQVPEWQWATQASGNYRGGGFGIALDENGNSYVTGYFEETAAFGSHYLTSSGDSDIFVAKMDAFGNWLWATKAGGSLFDLGNGIVIDNNGNSYVTGHIQDLVVFGSDSLTCIAQNIVVAKMDVNGNWLWATQAGGESNIDGNEISIDNDGNIYVTGNFYGTAIFGSCSLTSTGNDNIFVAKLDASGNWLWATQAGGWHYDDSCGIVLDDDENSYVTGHFWDTATFGSYTLTSSGDADIFVAKIDTHGNWLWATKAGGSSIDHGIAITIDDERNSFVTGDFWDTATFGSYSLVSSGNRDIFVAKMDTNGNWLWATRASGSGSDSGNTIAIDNNNNSYIAGWFYDTTTFGSYSLASSGGTDVFTAKMDANGNWLWATRAGGTGNDRGNAIALDENGNGFVTGFFRDVATFGSYSLNCFGVSDIFVAKLNCYVSVENILIQTEMKLSNFPNPFNPETTIEFSIQNDSNVELSIFNIKGQKIKTLVQNEFAKGNHPVIWNGDDEFGNSVSSGIYYYKLNINGKIEAVKKCLLLK